MSDTKYPTEEGFCLKHRCRASSLQPRPGLTLCVMGSKFVAEHGKEPDCEPTNVALVPLPPGERMVQIVTEGGEWPQVPAKQIGRGLIGDIVAGMPQEVAEDYEYRTGAKVLDALEVSFGMLPRSETPNRDGGRDG